MLLGVVTGIMYLQYVLWAEFLLSPANESVWIDGTYLTQQLPYFYGFVLASAFLVTVVFLLHRFRGDSVAYEYVAAMYFALSLCYYSYQIGTLSLPVGAVMVGAPVVGFIFFNRTAVVLALGVAMVVQLVLSFGSARQWWSYAPIYAEARLDRVRCIRPFGPENGPVYVPQCQSICICQK